MTKLNFPTMAEQAVADWRSIKDKTVALTHFCEQRGAERTAGKPVIEYTFEDDSSVTIRGAGRAHKVQTHLP